LRKDKLLAEALKNKDAKTCEGVELSAKTILKEL